MNKLHRTHEFAELAGVTVRALHHYDRLMLLQPKRTEAGYRLYGERDLERLEQIVALKCLGLPLKQIKELLDGDTRGLGDVLRSQRRALEEKRRWLDKAINAIREAEQTLRPGEPPDSAVLKKIIEAIEMQENTDFTKTYYNEAAQEKLAARRKNWNPKLQEEATKAWTELFRDVEATLGEDPAGAKAQGLAARWKKLVEEFTGGEADIHAGLEKAWADRGHWPEGMKEKTEPFINRRVWDFIGKAMKGGAGPTV